MKILSIQVGKPKLASFRGAEVSTGIFKDPVTGPVRLGLLNLEGDGQADLKVHGGREKALYAYGYDVYPRWKELRPKDAFPMGAFGENLTVDTLSEDQIFVGDTYRLGSARVQACQPRFPCQKLAVKFQDLGILKQFNALKRPGVYYRVLEEGVVAAGDTFQLIEREKISVSIQELFEIVRPEKDGLHRVREILSVGALSESWKKKLASWLEGPAP